jgi:NACalpha-BTF3-like transcription factor
VVDFLKFGGAEDCYRSLFVKEYFVTEVRYLNKKSYRYYSVSASTADSNTPTTKTGLKTISTLTNCWSKSTQKLRYTMVEAKAQAAQLDSVTDVVQEQEVDEARAQEAMSALSSNKSQDAAAIELLKLSKNTANAVTQEDIQLICSELDVTEDVAVKALREAAIELGVTNRDSDAVVVAALRKLVTS